MCGHNLIMNPPYIDNYTGLNDVVNSFYKYTIASPNKLILGCKRLSFAKRKKKQHKVQVVARMRSSKKDS